MGRWPSSYRVCEEKWLDAPVLSPGSSAKGAAMGTIGILLYQTHYQQTAMPGYQTLQCRKNLLDKGLEGVRLLCPTL